MDKKKPEVITEESLGASLRRVVTQVMDYESSCDACYEFFKEFGMPRNSIVKIYTGCAHGYDWVDMDLKLIASKLVEYFAKKQEFEKCTLLQSLPVRDVKNFKNMANDGQNVLEFEVNCEDLYVFLKREGEQMFDFDRVTFTYTNANAVEFMVKLVNYFHDKKDFQKCIVLNPILDEVKTWKVRTPM